MPYFDDSHYLSLQGFMGNHYIIGVFETPLWAYGGQFRNGQDGRDVGSGRLPWAPVFRVYQYSDSWLMQ